MREDLNIKEVKYLQDLCNEKEFEMSAAELVEFKCVVTCIYRSPHSVVFLFFKISWKQYWQSTIKKKEIYIVCRMEYKLPTG